MNVDQFLQPMPESFYQVFPAQERDIIRARFEYEDRWRHDIWIRTGGGTDVIAGLDGNTSAGDTAVSQVRGMVSDLQRKIAELDAQKQVLLAPITTKDFNQISVIKEYTAVDYDFMDVTTSDTICLPLYPGAKAVIIAINGHSSSITIDGNGRLINGDSSVKSVQQNTMLTFYYLQITDRWHMSTTTVEDIEHKNRIETVLDCMLEVLERSNFQLSIITGLDEGLKNGG